jgi:predicted ATP-grasp superfamily ATP-dependent carboligase
VKIAVTDGNTRAALAITRSLGRRGHWIAVGAETAGSLAGASKYCAETFSYCSPVKRVREAAEQIASELQKREIEYFIPVADMTLMPVLEFSNLFKGINIPFPSIATVLKASNKCLLFQMAAKCEVPIPKTIFVQQPVDQEKICSELTDFPLVVKPCRSIFREDDSLVQAGVSYVHNKTELLRLLQLRPYLQRYPFLIQERVIGTGIGYFVLLHRGQPLAEFCHRRIREKPPSGGVSVYSESIPLRSDVREYSLRLLNELEWSGIAMVEFKLDRKTDTPMLMEINGRFWGSLQLAIDAGVDFPGLLVHSSNGSAGTAPEYRPYVRWRWLLGDLDNLLLHCFKEKTRLALPPGYPSRARALVRFLADFRQKEIGYDSMCRKDMGPFLHELRSYVTDLLH